MEVVGLAVDYLRRVWSTLGPDEVVDENKMLKWVCTVACLAWRFDANTFNTTALMAQLCQWPFEETRHQIDMMNHVLRRVLLRIIGDNDRTTVLPYINRPHSYRFLMLYRRFLTPDEGLWKQCVYTTTMAILNPATAKWLPSHTTLAACVLGTSLRGQAPPRQLIVKVHQVLQGEARSRTVELRDALVRQRPMFGVLIDAFGRDLWDMSTDQLTAAWGNIEQWL